MNKDETRKFYTIVQMTYRNHFKNITEMELKVGLTLWHNHFHNIPYTVMEKALMEYTATVESFPPTPASINKILFNMINIDMISADDCFDKIIKHINRYGSKPDKFDKLILSDFEKTIINKGTIKEIGMSQNISYERTMFVKKFNNAKETYDIKVRNNLRNLESKEIIKLIDNKQFLLGE